MFQSDGPNVPAERPAQNDNGTSKEKKADKKEKKYTKSQAETPRYGNFDIQKAFDDAVSRSFSGLDEEGDK